MTLNIRNERADALARELADIEGTTITDAVVTALREAIENRLKQESPQDTARRILARRGLSFKRKGHPVPAEAYHQLDHDLSGE